MRARYQHGYLRFVKRKNGSSCWEFMWREQEPSGKRVHRTAGGAKLTWCLFWVLDRHHPRFVRVTIRAIGTYDRGCRGRNSNPSFY